MAPQTERSRTRGSAQYLTLLTLRYLILALPSLTENVPKFITYNQIKKSTLTNKINEGINLVYFTLLDFTLIKAALP